MAYSLPVKYFNSFWLKKVVGETLVPGDPADPITEIVTTWVSGGSVDTDAYFPLPTWPGIPWKDSSDGYPEFPWGDTASLKLNQESTEENGRDRNWFVEEARITGGFNNTSVNFGIKAYTTEENDDDVQEHQFNRLIHSGVFNSTTGTNNTNVFSLATPITRALDPANGSIQKLFAEDTNLIVFQEDKVSRALIDKDTIYTAEGGTQTQAANVIIGQTVPYVGEFGISKYPESFAQYGFRKYFADKNRGTIMRLSRDGLTEISQYGMVDYFRDELNAINPNWQTISTPYVVVSKGNPGPEYIDSFTFDDSASQYCTVDSIKPGMVLSFEGYSSTLSIFVIAITGNVITFNQPFKKSDFNIPLGVSWPTTMNLTIQIKDKIIGAFDNYNKNYTVSIQPNDFNLRVICQNVGVNKTVAFDESINGWVSFYSYIPTSMFSLKNNFYSVNDYSLYQHYSESVDYATFYGESGEVNIEFIFNANQSMVKNFQTVNYEGASGWYVKSYIGDDTSPVQTPTDNLVTSSSQWSTSNDVASTILSYEEGGYIDTLTGQMRRAGFDRKENKYVANLINNSTPTNGEILWGNNMSGLKGYYMTVVMSIDEVTQPGFKKELFSVGTTFVRSSS